MLRRIEEFHAALMPFLPRTPCRFGYHADAKTSQAQINTKTFLALLLSHVHLIRGCFQIFQFSPQHLDLCFLRLHLLQRHLD